jgi:hypothetical protein
MPRQQRGELNVSVFRHNNIIDVNLHAPPKPDLTMLLNDIQAVEMVSEMQTMCINVVEVGDWESMVEVRFVDTGSGRFETYSLSAQSLLGIATLMLNSVDPRTVLAATSVVSRA